MNLILILLTALALVSCDNNKEKEVDTENAQALAKEAYIYAFPAVEHNKAVWSVLVNSHAPVNTFIADTKLFTHENTAVVSPNNDTFYSYAVCDMRNEPVVISVPQIENRYFCLQLCDVFTNCPDYISTLATGEGPGNYLLARSDWDGNPPAGIDKVIKIPATVVLILGRTQVFGVHDQDEAALIAKGYKAMPLSDFTGATPPSGDRLTWPYGFYDSKSGTVEGFFQLFNDMLTYQLLNADDKALMEKFKSIGLEAGKKFDTSQFDTNAWAAIQAGASEAKQEIEEQTGFIGKEVNTWHYAPVNSGNWGTDYMTRAAAAWKYIYVNTPEEAVYLTVDTDSKGVQLSGANNYTVTFAKEQIPEVKFFWSLTLYNDKGFLVENPIGRYNIKGGDDTLKYGEDGALTLRIQHGEPENLSTTNWLPAPEGTFYMILRMYGPAEEAIKGELVLPAIMKIN
ncbi:DUF1214 domain-containing protein [Parabacteroides sp. OttesenSCG-928-O15]|nr:DUF1214 domain-containing protein [Parabacteroides sp. OttesenSCG-928-O15]